jgi:hypothetical protein
MLRCRICGNEPATFQPAKHQSLCAACNDTTPRKVSRAAFELKYWERNVAHVPDSTRREFYADYLASTDDVDAYIIKTTTLAD